MTQANNKSVIDRMLVRSLDSVTSSWRQMEMTAIGTDLHAVHSYNRQLGTP